MVGQLGLMLDLWVQKGNEYLLLFLVIDFNIGLIQCVLYYKCWDVMLIGCQFIFVFGLYYDYCKSSLLVDVVDLCCDDVCEILYYNVIKVYYDVMWVYVMLLFLCSYVQCMGVLLDYMSKCFEGGGVSCIDFECVCGCLFMVQFVVVEVEGVLESVMVLLNQIIGCKIVQIEVLDYMMLIVLDIFKLVLQDVYEINFGVCVV